MAMFHQLTRLLDMSGRMDVNKEARRRAARLGSGRFGLMFKEYDVVALKREVSGIPLPACTSGTVLMVYPDSPMHYEVEFSDGKGKFYPGTYTVSEEDLTLIRQYDGR